MYNEKDLIEHSELMELLGYEDERSFKRWCDKQHIPMIKMGLKKYILSQYLTQYIDNQLVIFETSYQGKRKTKESASQNSKNTNNISFVPGNITILKYLSKYESFNKTGATQKK